MIIKKITIEPNGGEPIENAIVEGIKLVYEKKCDVDIQHSSGNRVLLTVKNVFSFISELLKKEGNNS